MKILKKIGIVLLVLVGIVLIAALFIDKEFTVTRSVEIDHPVEEVYDYAKYLKHQQEFSYWEKLDPEQKKSFTGNDGEVGAVMAWESTNENVGQGEQEIVKMIPNKQIDFVMRFKKPMESEGRAQMVFNGTSENCTHMEWSFSGDFSYPFNIMKPFIDFDGTLGPQLQEGLDNLKKVLDNK